MTYAAIADRHVCVGRTSACKYERQWWASFMVKQYKVLKRRVPSPSGGFLEAFHTAIVDMSCFGERHYDAAGYPYESAAEALMGDWIALGGDMAHAVEKVTHENKGGTSEQAAVKKDEGSAAGGARKRSR